MARTNAGKPEHLADETEQMQVMYLEKLREELCHRGLEVFLQEFGEKLSLDVVNPATGTLEDNALVLVVPCKDGLWWFWWSWAERIAIADDLDLAAGIIVRVLASLLPQD